MRYTQFTSGSNPSHKCKLGEHKLCHGHRGRGADKSICTCRCHGQRGYMESKRIPCTTSSLTDPGRLTMAGDQSFSAY